MNVLSHLTSVHHPSAPSSPYPKALYAAAHFTYQDVALLHLVQRYLNKEGLFCATRGTNSTGVTREVADASARAWRLLMIPLL
mmetsp:Transcript_13585/g.41285  ORF Transcript_13585/g.41285 Transcript_13585/m.41285 type:complete len:83 (-) Transcript_13585:269-517(-)